MMVIQALTRAFMTRPVLVAFLLLTTLRYRAVNSPNIRGIPSAHYWGPLLTDKTDAVKP